MHKQITVTVENSELRQKTGRNGFFKAQIFPVQPLCTWRVETRCHLVPFRFL